MEDLLKNVAVFGLSMAGSFVTGYVQKKTLRSQGMRTSIPATNSAVMGAGSMAATGDPISMLFGIGGALASSGLYSVQKRIKTGRW